MATIRESGYRRKPPYHDPPSRKRKGLPHVLVAIVARARRVVAVVPLAVANAVRSIRKSRASSRAIARIEAVARTARTTYVVTADEIASDGDRYRRRRAAKTSRASTSTATARSAPTRPSIRGSSTQQVLVLLDGLPVAGAQIDGLNMEPILHRRRQRIEVVEGGGSTLYGSGSIGGVDQYHYAAIRGASNASAATGSFGSTTYRFRNAVGLVLANVRGQRLPVCRTAPRSRTLRPR